MNRIATALLFFALPQRFVAFPLQDDSRPLRCKSFLFCSFANQVNALLLRSYQGSAFHFLCLSLLFLCISAPVSSNQRSASASLSISSPTPFCSLQCSSNAKLFFTVPVQINAERNKAILVPLRSVPCRCMSAHRHAAPMLFLAIPCCSNPLLILSAQLHSCSIRRISDAAPCISYSAPFDCLHFLGGSVPFFSPQNVSLPCSASACHIIPAAIHV